MDGNFEIRLNEFDIVNVRNGDTLVTNNGDIEINQKIGWQNVRRIALQYLRQADDKERTQIWHELYDDLSYEELEAKYLEASNEADNLKAEIENLRQSKDRKVFDY